MTYNCVYFMQHQKNEPTTVLDQKTKRERKNYLKDQRLVHVVHRQLSGLGFKDRKRRH